MKYLFYLDHIYSHFDNHSLGIHALNEYHGDGSYQLISDEI